MSKELANCRDTYIPKPDVFQKVFMLLVMLYQICLPCRACKMAVSTSANNHMYLLKVVRYVYVPPSVHNMILIPLHLKNV